jgi:Ca2+/Na+ antiporter
MKGCIKMWSLFLNPLYRNIVLVGALILLVIYLYFLIMEQRRKKKASQILKSKDQTEDAADPEDRRYI